MVAATVTGGFVALQQRDGMQQHDSTRSTGSPQDSVLPQPPVGALVFETPKVRFVSERVELVLLESVLVPADAAAVGSDPRQSDIITLELKWTESGVEYVIRMRFANDGVNWWVDQILISDSAGLDEDVTPRGNRLFLTPLGQAHRGDLSLPKLRITDMTLEAFLRPSECENPSAPIIVVAMTPVIDATVGPDQYGTLINLIDTATCESIDMTSFTLEYVSEDPTIAEVRAAKPLPGQRVEDAHAMVMLLAPGQTTIRVTVTDKAGQVVGTDDIEIHSRASVDS